MVYLRDAMVLWSKIDHEKDKSFPNIKVVAQGQSREIKRYDYLSSSSGSCFAKWSVASDVDRAGFIMALANIIAARGKISFDEIHKAFLEIEEYKEFRDRVIERELENPFWKLYYAAV